MSRKKWGIFFLAALALIIAAWAAVNILWTPSASTADVLFHWDSYSQTLNSRNGKAAYLSQRFEDYDSYVIGSGAASAYTPEILETYLGGSFYNLFHDEADPEYDAQLVAYLLEQDPDVKQIFLVLGPDDAQRLPGGRQRPHPAPVLQDHRRNSPGLLRPVPVRQPQVCH